MARVFVTRRVPGRAVEMLAGAGHEVDLWPGELPPSPAELAEHVSSASAVLAMVTDRFDANLFEAAPELRIVANMAVGYDNVDPATAAAAGAWLTNTPGVLAETTADFAFALLLAAARLVPQSERDTRAGGWKTWSPTAFLGSDVHGATIGVVGAGEIGSAVARRAHGFAMRILYTARSPKPALERALGAEWCDLDELLRESDFVTLHTPLTPETRHMVGARELRLMKKTALLVNSARGGIVDQDALVEALSAGEIGGAALDVTTPEPLPPDHPLYRFPNVVITPHIGSASTPTRARMAEMAAENIIAVLGGGEPRNAVNRPPRPRGN
jgi:glyoxylate reductase